MDFVTCRIPMFLFGLFTFGYIQGEPDTTPIIKSVPITVRVREHESVLLPCYIDSLGASKITWWKDDEIVAQGNIVFSGNLVLFPNNTLEVSDVTVTDTGRYTCQVTRPPPWGPINQQHAIEVLYPPRINMTPTGEVEVEVNEEVTISCYAEGAPKPEITWLFKGDELKLLSTRDVLRFVASDGSLTGEYSCVATNGIGDTTSSSVFVRVIYPPKVSIDKSWVHSSPNMRSEVSCDIDGSPHPQVEWHLDNVPVIYNHRVHKSKHRMKHSLVITRTTSSDFGYYKCIASNKLGSNYQVVQLSALPNIPEFKKTQNEKRVDRATLAWEVDSYSPINQYNLLFRRVKANEAAENWTKIIVPGDASSTGPIHGQVYTLTGLTPATVYEAAVVSRNRFGWGRPSNIYRFTTLGIELETALITTEGGGNTETNTFDAILSDYSSKTEEYAKKLSTRNFSLPLHTTPVFLLVSTTFWLLRSNLRTIFLIR